MFISAFFASSVEAVTDFHGHADGGDDRVLVESGDHDEPEAHGCDHCCHLAGHLLGLPAGEAWHLVLDGCVIDGLISEKWRGRGTEPPNPPPNIQFF